MGLRGRVAAANDTAAMRGRGARYVDAASLAHRPRESGHRFPRRAAEADRSSALARLDTIRRRHRVEVMTQIARGRQIRWLAVFVTAVAGDRLERIDGRLERG